MKLPCLLRTPFLTILLQILVYRLAANDPRARWRGDYQGWESYTPPAGNSTQWSTLTGGNSSITSATIASNLTTARTSSSQGINMTITPTGDSHSASTTPTTLLTKKLSSASSPPPSKPTPPLTLSITISSTPQHTGQWYSTYIASDLSAHLTSHCRTSTPTCSSSSSKYNNIEYSTSAGYVEKSSSYVSVSVSSSRFPDKKDAGRHDGKALRKLLIEQVAETYRVATEDSKNCYWFDRRSSMCTFCKLCIPDGRERVVKWCNSPQSVRVGLRDQGAGKEIAHLEVQVKFTGKTEQGRFDCEAVREAVGKGAEKERVGEVGRASGGKGVGVKVACDGQGVRGSCPNVECTYRLGLCFKGAKGG